MVSMGILSHALTKTMENVHNRNSHTSIMLFQDPSVTLESTLPRAETTTPRRDGALYTAEAYYSSLAASASALASLMAISSRSNTSTELAGMAGVGLCSP